MKTKQYIALAKAIKENRFVTSKGLDAIATTLFLVDLCVILKEENPKFDENKFKELLK